MVCVLIGFVGTLLFLFFFFFFFFFFIVVGFYIIYYPGIELQPLHTNNKPSSVKNKSQQQFLKNPIVIQHYQPKTIIIIIQMSRYRIVGPGLSRGNDFFVDGALPDVEWW